MSETDCQRTGFSLLGKSVLFVATRGAFGVLCTLKRDPGRCDSNWGGACKSLCFSDMKTLIAVFYGKCKGLGFFGSRNAQFLFS